MSNLSINLTFLLLSHHLFFCSACYAMTYKTDPYGHNTMLFGHELVATGCCTYLNNLRVSKWRSIFNDAKEEKKFSLSKKGIKNIYWQTKYFCGEKQSSKKREQSIELMKFLSEFSADSNEN
ncbi:MAG: hypothetical protein WCD44_02385 [Candidatus Babeliales bacterium]|jgi:hypothetical protein